MTPVSFLLFLYGMWFIVVGKARFGAAEREGSIVRAAGFLLALPFVGGYFLTVMIDIIFGADNRFCKQRLFLVPGRIASGHHLCGHRIPHTAKCAGRPHTDPFLSAAGDNPPGRTRCAKS